MSETPVTLCFILKGGRVLLIRKKRGIGMGKINGPGGKVDPGEAPLSAAIRETREEIGVVPLEPSLVGDLQFRFKDGLRLRCFIYLAVDFEGEPHETEEAVPLWFDLDKIPYAEMWEDDQHWLPILLRREQFRGWVEVDGERVTAQKIETLQSNEKLPPF